MQLSTLTSRDIIRAKQLWASWFEDGTPGFCDMIFSLIPPEDIYILKDDGRVVSMLMVVAGLEYNGKKGFYIYSACTDREYTGKGCMSRLAEYALKDQSEKGYVFCVLQPADEKLFEFWKKQGFDKKVAMRKCVLDIKRNIWQSADFDIVTAARFRQVREKHTEEKILHYTPKGYEKYTQYMYTSFGSTAETPHAYRVYSTEFDKLVVKELMADSTLHAMQLLQAIRERTGYEQATVYLSANSNLFLGEGRQEDVYAVRNLDEDVYISLMFE